MMAKLTKNKNHAPKSRKAQRKVQRKKMKQRKFEQYMNRNKPGKFVLNNNKSDTTDKEQIATIKSKNVDMQFKKIKAEKEAHKKLQKDMARQRKKQLKAANIDEDRTIKQLEKQLKLNKRKNKNKSIPKSFASDGLDYLLEVCEPENMKSIATAEQQFADLNDEFEDDFALVTGKNLKSKKTEVLKNDSDSDLDGNASNSDETDEESENLYDSHISDHSNLEIDEEQECKLKVNNKRKKNKSELESDIKREKKQKSNDDDNNKFDDNSSDESSIEDVNNLDKNEIWEDIYGRTRNKTGAVITEKNEGKYIPPAIRALKENNVTMDQKRAEKIIRLKKQIKGFLNRLTESNMHSISHQIEEMYMCNSRNDMNETLTHLVFEAIIAPVITPERLLLEYMSLVTILHANVGTEVGAHFLQSVVKKYDELYNKETLVENKELDNTVHTIAQLYNFKVFHSQLLYQILNKLSEKFEEKHVECILLVLKNAGFSLRKDDPLALKQLILDLQKKAATVDNNNSRVKYMLDILLAIKNNNVSKIPNYDTSYSEHLKKLLKNFIRKGNYVTQLNISLKDLLKADERGRWWIVGSAWTGDDDKKQNKDDATTSAPFQNKKIVELAKKQRMNTDTRRNIFCVLMMAENYTDAFEKILSIGLKGQQEREIIHVLLHCSLQEKQYNPYYTFLAQKFCEYDRKYQMMIRCSIWDKLKTLSECSGKQIILLAKILTHLFLNQGLPISTLKVIQFSELDQVTLRLIRQVLLGILLNSDEEAILSVFEKLTTSPKLKMFRESLRLFIHHFLLRNLSNTDLPEEHKSLLSSRAKLVEKSLSVPESKIRF